MPYATTDDGVKLYYEEVGSGAPIVFVHEFAADHRSWEMQMRHFGHAVADEYAKGAEDGGHEVKRIEVAKLDFPFLRTKEKMWQAIESNEELKNVYKLATMIAEAKGGLYSGLKYLKDNLCKQEEADYIVSTISDKIHKLMKVKEGTRLKAIDDYTNEYKQKYLTKDQYYEVRSSSMTDGYVTVLINGDNNRAQWLKYSYFEDVQSHRDDLLSSLFGE